MDWGYIMLIWLTAGACWYGVAAIWLGKRGSWKL